MSPPAAGGTEVGAQATETLRQHGARSAVRRLVVALFDAWDAGDVDGFCAVFSPDASWAAETTGEVTGIAAVGARFLQWRRWEPFSVHLLGNESVDLGGDAVSGRWVWIAASDVDFGATPAWSAGDLHATFAHGEAGWRIESLHTSARFRTPYAQGWLLEPLVGPELDDVASATLPAPPIAGDDEGLLGQASGRLTDLLAESEVRWVVGEYLDALERGAGAAELADAWIDQGRYSSTTDDEVLHGLTAVEAHRHDVVADSAVLTAVFSQEIVVEGEVATATWRELSTARVGGAARWVARRHDAELVLVGERWKLRRLRRETLLDCDYVLGWTPTTTDVES